MFGPYIPLLCRNARYLSFKRNEWASCKALGISLIQQRSYGAYPRRRQVRGMHTERAFSGYNRQGTTDGRIHIRRNPQAMVKTYVVMVTASTLSRDAHLLNYLQRLGTMSSRMRRLRPSKRTRYTLQSVAHQMFAEIEPHSDRCCRQCP